MVTEFDDKGKVFTDVIPKEPVPVLIQMQSHQIHGEIYVRPGYRIIDELNAAGTFLAITNAVIFHPDGREAYRSNFLSINVDQIVWLVPEAELTATRTPLPHP